MPFTAAEQTLANMGRVMSERGRNGKIEKKESGDDGRESKTRGVQGAVRTWVTLVVQYICNTMLNECFNC